MQANYYNYSMAGFPPNRGSPRIWLTLGSWFRNAMRTGRRRDLDPRLLPKACWPARLKMGGSSIFGVEDRRWGGFFDLPASKIEEPSHLRSSEPKIEEPPPIFNLWSWAPSPRVPTYRTTPVSFIIYIYIYICIYIYMYICICICICVYIYI